MQRHITKMATLTAITLATGSFCTQSMATQFLPQSIALPPAVRLADEGVGFNQAFLATAYIIGQTMLYDIEVKEARNQGTFDLPPYYNTGQISLKLRNAIQSQQEADELARTIEFLLPQDGSPSPAFEEIKQDPQNESRVYNFLNLIEGFGYSETGISNIIRALEEFPGGAYSIDIKFRENLSQSVKEARQYIRPLLP
jgi:hypothetical protein